MKTTATIGLAALLLGANAFAGETTSTTSYSPPPPESSPLWTWFVGGSAGYFFDSEEEYYTLHFGAKVGQTGPITHSLMLEGLYTETSELLLDTEIIPVTLNYKLDYALNDSLSLYAGVGAGAAFVSNDILGFSDDSVEFAAQIFAGLGYSVTPNFEIYGGGRWLFVDDSEVLNRSVDIGDDVGAELGLRFKF